MALLAPACGSLLLTRYFVEVSWPVDLDKVYLPAAVTAQEKLDTYTHSRTPSGWINTVPLTSNLSAATLSKRSITGSSSECAFVDYYYHIHLPNYFALMCHMCFCMAAEGRPSCVTGL